MGIYQIKGMGSINRRGVGIRYKLVVERGETALEGRMEELGTEDNDAVVWKLAWAQDRHLDAQREVAMFEAQLSQLLGRAKGAPPITASGGQTEKEIQRVKNDLTIAQKQDVLLSQEVTRLEAMLKRPGKLSSSLEAVPLTTQLSEALRAKAAAEKDVTDLESLLLHAGEGLKTSPDSPEARFNMELGQRELSIAKARAALWEREVARLQARLALSSLPQAERPDQIGRAHV